ncbi:MAG: hypothetical protein BroJett040_13640 [Oligoflexia bacterium]|nr:MAG: hypothetical protein BroJett040_13640 [Oligoflexia bacterium]
MGGVHGDEPEGVQLATDLLHWLQKNNNLNLKPWILIPCLNVDGYSKAQRTNSNGVDLNRNFQTPDWSPESKAPRYYPGPYPNSEKETQALTNLIETEKPSLIVHFHSWEPCIVYTGQPGSVAAKTLAEDTPYEYKEDIGYPTPGSLGQYGWLSQRTPVICIEAQEKSDLNTLWPIFGPGLQKILRLE